MSKSPAVVVVLAAGPGSRFHGPEPKLAARLGLETMLAHSILHALASRLPVVVVTTARFADDAARLVARRDLVVLPESPPLGVGLGQSVAAGVQVRSGASGWVMVPADMPLLLPATIRAVAAALPQHALAFAQHQGRSGQPVGVSAELYSELLRLRGDDALRRLLARYPAHPVAVDDPGALHDVDTLDDLTRTRLLLALRSNAVAG